MRECEECKQLIDENDCGHKILCSQYGAEYTTTE